MARGSKRTVGGKNGQRRDEPAFENRRARHEYHVDETVECGVVLLGTEVKSIRAGRASIAEGYVRATSEPLRIDLLNVHIDEYAPAGASRQHRPTQSRKLLAHKREIRKLAKAQEQKGVTLVPLKMYFKNGYVKVLVGIARGKREYDKRQDIKKRDQDRELRRAMSRRA